MRAATLSIEEPTIERWGETESKSIKIADARHYRNEYIYIYIYACLRICIHVEMCASRNVRKYIYIRNNERERERERESSSAHQFFLQSRSFLTSYFFLIISL